jgi:ABC-2 type transport system ATP-binding protein
MTAIVVNDLSHVYGATVALDRVSLAVEPGELFCVTGPDGAGKSTLLRLLAGTIKPASGAITILGMDAVARPWPLRNSVGYMPQRFAIYADLTCSENLEFYCSFYGLDSARTRERVATLLRVTALEEFARFRAGNLSGGMKQKLVLGCALVHEPPVLLLDEPTTGIDPLSRREFWRILTAALGRGTTIVYSSVYLEEAARSSRIALMRRGRIAACAAPDVLLERVRGRRFRLDTDNPSPVAAALRALPAVLAVQTLGNGVAWLVGTGPGSADAALAALRTAGIAAEPQPAPATLEDVIIDAGTA